MRRTRKRGRVVVVCSALVGGLACGGATPSSPTPVEIAGGHRVLFIGNSLTYTNDLPGMLTAIAKSSGDTIVTASVVAPGYAVIDHITPPTATDALARIAGARWEYVVLQQGPTSRPIDRDTLVLAAQRLEPAIRAAGGRTALYMVWPAMEDSANFDRVRLSFRQAACSSNGVFWPAGEAWRAAWRVDPTMPLYGPDRFHPSALGTYLAALVMYERITGKDARALPQQWTTPGFASPLPSTIRALQVAAHAANTAFPTACDP